MITLIDSRITSGRYGLKSESMIIDHTVHGRVLLMDGYGDEDTPDGGAYRWRHGMALKLQASDTFAECDGTDVHGHETNLSMAIHSEWPGRRLLRWDGETIARLAVAAVAR